ncbi:MAG TPA: addiction module protein [Pyrinomonadaceae bacterium]|nr:addiction module protein [Pyrinomonadaceae bacterium]HMP66745.1 addiction module protein [Pyrinomonadaceae bacterium]
MNIELVLPLDKMTVAEKMDVIDRIMDDLSRNASSVPEIEWHGEVLKQRAENLRIGNDRFISLEEAEQRIREKTGRK